MSNMSYCRFRNTDSDLADCEGNIGETEDMGIEELQAMIWLVERCQDIASCYDEHDLSEWRGELEKLKEEENNG